MTGRALMLLVALAALLSVGAALHSEDAAENEALRSASAIGTGFAIPDRPETQDSARVRDAIIGASEASGANVLRQSFGFDADRRPLTRLFLLQTRPTGLERALRIQPDRWPSPERTRTPEVLLATRGTNQHSAGLIEDIFHNDRVTVEGFPAAFTSLPAAGTYRVESPDPEGFAVVLAQELNDHLGVRAFSAEDLRADTTVVVAGFPAQPYLLLAVVAATAAAILLATYRQVSETKRAGVLVLHGYHPTVAWFAIAGRPIGAAFLAAGVIGMAASCAVPGITAAAIRSAAAAMSLCAVAMLAASGLVAMWLAHTPVGEALKNRRRARPVIAVSSLLKTGFAVVLVVALAGIGTELSHHVSQVGALRYWEKTADYAVFTPRTVGSDLADIAAGTDTGALAEAKDLYPRLNRAGALYVQPAQLNDPDEGRGNQAGDLSAQFPSMTVNPNYLQRYPIKGPDGAPIRVSENERDWVVLAPDQLRPAEHELREHFQQRRTGDGQSPGAAGAAADMAGLPISPQLHGQKVRVQFYPSGQDVFSFSPLAGRDHGYLLRDPIVEVMTMGNSSTDDRLGGLTGGGEASLKVKLVNRDPAQTLAQLAPFLKELHLDDNLPRLQTMTDVAMGQLRFSEDGIRITGIIAALLTLGVLGLGVQSMVLLFGTYERTVVVRRLFGYSFVAKYREPLSVLAATIVLQFLGVLALATTRITFFSQVPPTLELLAVAFLILLAVELSMAWLCLRKMESDRAADVLKGEF